MMNICLSARFFCFVQSILADLDKPVCWVGRCSRSVFARRVRDVDKRLSWR